MKKFINCSLQIILIAIITIVIHTSFISDTGSGKSVKWKTGVALYSFNRFSFPDALNKADSAGAKYVEGFFFHKLGKDFNDHTIPGLTEEEIVRMKGLMDKKGIKMRSLYAGGAKNIAEWEAFFVFAQKIGIEFLVAEPEKKHWDSLDSLAGKYKIKIAIHQHAKGLSQYWHPDSVLAALKGHPNFGVCADLGHWVRSGLDPVKCLQTLKGHIISVHLKDLDTFGNVNANDVVVGTGVIDFPAVIRELKLQNFGGMVYVEREANWEHNMPDVRQAIRHFVELSKKNGK